MSKFRDKAREVKAAGVAQRGNFAPTGVPRDMYKFWMQNSNSTRARDVRAGRTKENFCHFFRVVALWAPLMGIRKFAEKNFTSKGAMAVMLILAIAVIAVLSASFNGVAIAVGWTLAVAAVIIVLVAGTFTGASMAFSDEEIIHSDVLIPKKWSRWGIIAFPTFIPAYLIARNRDWDGWDAVGVGAFLLAIVAFVVTVCWSIVAESGFLSLLAAIAGLVALCVVLVLVGALGNFLSDYVSGRRALAREKNAAAVEAYIEEHGKYPPTAKEPGKIEKILSGIGDFCVFIGQVIRTKKWKFCPTVEIDTTN